MTSVIIDVFIGCYLRGKIQNHTITNKGHWNSLRQQGMFEVESWRVLEKERIEKSVNACCLTHGVHIFRRGTTDSRRPVSRCQQGWRCELKLYRVVLPSKQHHVEIQGEESHPPCEIRVHRQQLYAEGEKHSICGHVALRMLLNQWGWRGPR